MIECSILYAENNQVTFLGRTFVTMKNDDLGCDTV
jgi:hypothetical protein